MEEDFGVIARVLSGAIYGVDAFTVDVEVDFSRKGLPAFSMVGLADNAVRESRDRVFSALKSSSYTLPPARITVNLAPADRKKVGSVYDLPLAIGLLLGAGVVPPEATAGFYMAGELSLTGEVRPVHGILPLAILARDKGARGFLVPAANAAEAAVVEGLAVYPVQSVSEAVEFFLGTPLQAVVAQPFSVSAQGHSPLLDYADVKGQEHAKRAVEIATAGGHNMLFLGPPGSGKSMLAQRLPSVLPPLSFEEALETTKIYSVAGLLEADHGLIQERPFRTPHHTISEYGLIGGGAWPKPGEISLAHRGVLFLDELLEFRKQTLEVLRQPLETGAVTIARATQTVQFPAHCMLIAAMNPCPCGYLTDTRRPCTCTPSDIRRYRARLSGPLLDRIDLHVEVPAVSYADMSAEKPGKSSVTMRENVMQARAIQAKRYAGTGISGNAALQGQALDTYCALDTKTRSFLGNAVERLCLSARAYTRILRLARTIADLQAEEHLSLAHVAEAINCRCLDREQGM